MDETGRQLGPTAEAKRPQIILASHDGKPPKIPERRPESARERNRIGRIVAWYLQNTTPLQRAIFLARAGWLVNEAGHTIHAYFDPPKSLDELRRNASRSRPGYDVHHIVERTPAERDGFPGWQIEGDGNKVSIPRYKHWEITAWYGTKNEEFGGLSPRDYLRGKSWEERYQVGLDALAKFGVLTR